VIIESITCRDPGDVGGWPFSMPAVVQIQKDGLQFTAPGTFLVGENGTGKSTIIEAIADACGINSAGGKAGTRYASTGPKTPLGQALGLHLTPSGVRLLAGPRHKRKGFFLRAETLFNLAQNVTGLHGFWNADLTAQSHGEGFLTVLRAMFSEPGIYLMDEPEAALSFRSCLGLVSLLDRLAATGAQVICATHSPLLAALPGAQILELSSSGIRPVPWAELEIVDHWRRYLADPSSYLRHLLAAEPP
jgi:predicted ATPase